MNRLEVSIAPEDAHHNPHALIADSDLDDMPLKTKRKKRRLRQPKRVNNGDDGSGFDEDTDNDNDSDSEKRKKHDRLHTQQAEQIQQIHPHPPHEAAEASGTDEEAEEEEEDEPLPKTCLSFRAFPDEELSSLANETELIRDKKWCFACQYSQDAVDAHHNRAYTGLLELLEAGYAHMGPKQLAKDVQKFYNEELRKYTRGSPPWSQVSIYAHASGKHVPRPAQSTMRSIKQLTKVADEIYNTSICMDVYENSVVPTRRAVHAGNTRLLLQVISAEQKLWRDYLQFAKPSRFVDSDV